MDVFRYLPVPLLLLVLTVGLVAAATAAVPGMRRGDRRAAAVASCRVLLAGALLGVLALTQVTSYGGGRVNLVPFASIASELGNANPRLAVANILGNALLFVPVGLLLPTATGWRWSRSAVAVVVLVVAIELLQLLTGRSADIDDVILNSLGGVLAAVPGAWIARRASALPPRVRTSGARTGV
ncbi:VanZ family protein [Quadrisphaera granulorum]|uniref:VanZ family protein n=1 Tax=Quadrisphaera granulorum TaxID=317664 RepID=UPI000D6C4181|nr:VanZ family protein [Quadrisphaera granulorum]